MLFCLFTIKLMCSVLVIYIYIFFFIFKLPELVNAVSEQGHLPLQMALIAQNAAIAQTLVKNGSADINAYDAEVKFFLLTLITNLYNKFLIRVRLS